MEKLMLWITIFIIVYLTYLLFVIIRKNKKAYNENTYISYLIRVYKLNESKINMNKLIHVIALANAFIIASTFIIISYPKNFIVKMFLAFIVLIPLQLFIYHILGKILKRGEKDV